MASLHCLVSAPWPKPWKRAEAVAIVVLDDQLTGPTGLARLALVAGGTADCSQASPTLRTAGADAGCSARVAAAWQQPAVLLHSICRLARSTSQRGCTDAK